MSRTSDAGEPMTPYYLTFLTTYRCTAACRECCFKCLPNNPSPLIRVEDIVWIIDEAVDNFQTLKVVVFSGGECFLLGKGLFCAIGHAAEKNLITRCVTNGYWGRNRRKARLVAERLLDAGLKEINFSTGDDHQVFVPIDAVVNAAMECAQFGIYTLIVVEGHEKSTFKLRNLVEHPDLSRFITTHEKARNIHLMQNIWIPFDTNRKLEYPDRIKLEQRARLGTDTGCNQILTGIAVTPDLYLAGCCGLTMECIDEPKMGKIQKGNLRALYDAQLDDFMKVWLFTDGPQRILEFVRSTNPLVTINSDTVHPCQACTMIYNNEVVRNVIVNHYKPVVEDVLVRFHLKKERITRAGKQAECAHLRRNGARFPETLHVPA